MFINKVIIPMTELSDPPSYNICLRIKIFYSETQAAKVCLPFVCHLMRNLKDVNRISFLYRGYAFKGLLAVLSDCVYTASLSEALGYYDTFLLIFSE